jgi:membrane-anchored protein YejM (alkaline phosphatase superfamily)
MEILNSLTSSCLAANALCSGHCFGGKPNVMHVLDTVLRFMQVHRNRPSFAYTNLVDLSHDSSTDVSFFNGLTKKCFQIETVDLHIAKWLTYLRDTGLLDNTVLLVWGDHGPRFGDVPRWENQMHLFHFMNVYASNLLYLAVKHLSAA